MNYCTDLVVRQQKIADPHKPFLPHMRTLPSMWYLLEGFWSPVGSTLTSVATGRTIPQITAALDAKAWCSKEHYFINLQRFMLLTSLDWRDCCHDFGHMWYYLKICCEIEVNFMLVDGHRTVNATAVWKSCWDQF